MTEPKQTFLSHAELTSRLDALLVEYTKSGYEVGVVACKRTDDDTITVRSTIDVEQTTTGLFWEVWLAGLVQQIADVDIPDFDHAVEVMRYVEAYAASRGLTLFASLEADDADMVSFSADPSFLADPTDDDDTNPTDD